jgi:hypothetical protein
MVRIICSSIGDIVQHFFSVQTVSLRNSEKTNRTEGPLGVNIQALSLPTTHVHRQLACDCKRVAQLRLSRPELSEEFSNRTGLDTTLNRRQHALGSAINYLTTQERIEVLRSGSYVHKL